MQTNVALDAELQIQHLLCLCYWLADSWQLDRLADRLTDGAERCLSMSDIPHHYEGLTQGPIHQSLI